MQMASKVKYYHSLAMTLRRLHSLSLSLLPAAPLSRDPRIPVAKPESRQAD